MTFSERAKREIIKTEYQKSCCQLSHLYGMLCFAKKFSKYETVFSSEHSFLVKHFKQLFTTCGFDIGTVVTTRNQKGGAATITNREQLDRLLFDFGYHGAEANLRLNSDNLMCDECFGAFLAGAFLAGGTVTDPKVNYHMEFATHKSAFLGDFRELLEQHDFSPKVSVRGYSKILYFKDSGQIEDLLAICGAVSSSMQLMDEKILKELRNKANRQSNCESANIDKLVAASAGIRSSIEYLMQHGDFESLDDNLKAVANARMDNPELSLSELGETLNPPIAKSAVNYRLNKIKALADELKENNNDT